MIIIIFSILYLLIGLGVLVVVDTFSEGYHSSDAIVYKAIDVLFWPILLLIIISYGIGWMIKRIFKG